MQSPKRTLAFLNQVKYWNLGQVRQWNSWLCHVLLCVKRCKTVIELPAERVPIVCQTAGNEFELFDSSQLAHEAALSRVVRAHEKINAGKTFESLLVATPSLNDVAVKWSLVGQNDFSNCNH